MFGFIASFAIKEIEAPVSINNFSGLGDKLVAAIIYGAPFSVNILCLSGLVVHMFSLKATVCNFCKVFSVFSLFSFVRKLIAKLGFKDETSRPSCFTLSSFPNWCPLSLNWSQWTRNSHRLNQVHKYLPYGWTPFFLVWCERFCSARYAQVVRRSCLGYYWA